MIQPAVYILLGENPNSMTENGYGSILSNLSGFDYKEWQELPMFSAAAAASQESFPVHGTLL